VAWRANSDGEAVLGNVAATVRPGSGLPWTTTSSRPAVIATAMKPASKALGEGSPLTLRVAAPGRRVPRRSRARVELWSRAVVMLSPSASPAPVVSESGPSASAGAPARPW